MSNRISEGAAHKAFDLLVRYGQADDDARDMFVRYATTGLDEWRFIGSLGIGGKIYLMTHPKRALYVNCYLEDSNDERNAFMRFLNGELAKVEV